MSATTIKPATKYRVAIRDIAIRNGWTFEQVSESTDRFEKNNSVALVHHGPSNLITRAELTTPKGTQVSAKSGKMFDVQAWLTGVADPDRSNFIRLSPEQVKKFESGESIAKIAAEHEIHVAPAPFPAAKPRKAPAKKAEAEVKPVSAPAPKPAPRAAKTAPAVASK